MAAFFGAIELAALLAALAPEIAVIADLIATRDPVQVIDDIETIVGSVEDAISTIKGIREATIFEEAEAVGRPIVEAIITQPLGISGGLGEAEAGDAMTTLARAFGVGVQLPLASLTIGTVLKATLGHRGADLAEATVGKISEEIGLPFFLGTVMASLFERAVGTPLEEAINLTHHPNRVNDRIVARLLQQHKIDDATADHLLDLQGFPDEHKQYLKALDQQFIPFGDLQQAYLFGLIDNNQLLEQLARVGFSDEDISILGNLIITKTATEGGAFYRSVARGAFKEAVISEAQFREILSLANIPPSSIELEVAAIHLEQQMDRKTLTVSERKQAFLVGDLSYDVVRQSLLVDGYSEDDATLLIQTWIDAAKPSEVLVSENRILTYLLSGVIAAPEAILRLIALGMAPDNARFLVQHPSSFGNTFRYNLTPNLVASAVKEKVLDVDAAKSLLINNLNTDPIDAALIIEVAVAQQAKDKVARESHKNLTVNDYKDAFELGLIDIAALHRFLVQLGYTETDANLLTAIWFTKAVGQPPDDWMVIT